jgi:hypothetical protein
VLGLPRADLLKAWKAGKALDDGAEVFFPGEGPYQVVRVWYQGGKVSRIIADHRERPRLDDREVEAALQRVWSQGFDQLGFVRLQVGRVGHQLGAYYWHDDRTRVNAFVHDTNLGPRLFTEWRGWPVGSGSSTARK